MITADEFEKVTAERDAARAQPAAAQAEAAELRRVLAALCGAVPYRDEEALFAACQNAQATLASPTCAQPLLDVVEQAAEAMAVAERGHVDDPETSQRLLDAIRALAPWRRK